jgi:hypothetical protein
VQGGRSETVVSAIGAYKGERPLVMTGSITFEVVADGAWTLIIRPMEQGGTPSFAGSGDAVSAYFTAPAPGPWNVSHDGQSQFVVFAHCVGNSLKVEDVSGAMQDVATINFPRGPCFWEVQADGNWSLKPQ